MAAPTPAELIARALVIMKTQKALGARLGRSREHVSRVAAGSKLSVSACLRLAEIIGERAPVVLRAYGYKVEAAVLDRLYQDGQISAAQRQVLDDLDAIDDVDQERITGLLRTLAKTRKR